MPTITTILPSTTDLSETAGSLSRANSPTPSNASSTKSIWPSFKRVTSSIGQYAPSSDFRSSLIGSSRKRDSGPDEGMWDKNDDVFLEQIALQVATPDTDLRPSPQLSAPLPMHPKVPEMEGSGPLQSSNVDPDIFKSPLFAALHHNQQLPPPSVSLLSSASPPPQLSKHHQISQWTATSLDAHPYEELSTTSSPHESMQSLSSAPLNLNESPRGNVSTSPLTAPSRFGGAGGGGVQTYKSMSNYSGSGSEASSSVLTFPSPASSRMELDRKAGTNAGLAALSNSTGARLPYDSNITSSETSPTTASFVTGNSPIQPVSTLAPRRHAYKASFDDVDRRDPSSKRSSGKSFDDEIASPSSDMQRPPLASTIPSEPPAAIHHSASSPSMISADVAPWLHMSLDSVKRSRQQQQIDNSSSSEALRSIPAEQDAAKGSMNASVNAKSSHPAALRTRNDEGRKDPNRKDGKDQEDAVFIVSADGPSRSTQLRSASVSGETSGFSSRAESPRPKRGFVVGLKKLVQEGTSKGSPKQKPSRKGSLSQGLFDDEEGAASAAATEDHRSSVRPSKNYESEDVHVVSAETTFKNWTPSWGRGAATHDGTIHFPTQSHATGTTSKFSGIAAGSRRPSTGSMVSPRADTFGNDIQSSRQVRRPKTSTTTTAVAAHDPFRKHIRSGSVDAQQRSRVDQRRPSTCSSVAESSYRHQPQVGQLMRSPAMKDDGVVRSRSRTGTEPVNKLTRESRTRPSSRASIIEHTSHEDARMRSGVSSGAVPIGSSSKSLRNTQNSRDEDREEVIASHTFATRAQALRDKSEPIIRGVSPMRPQRTMEDAGSDFNPARSSINDAFNAAHDRRWSSTVSSPFEKHIPLRRGSDAPFPHFFSMGRRGSDTSVRNLPIAKPVAPMPNVSSISTSRSPSSATSPSPRNSALATASTSPPTYSDPWSANDTRVHSPFTTTKSSSSQHGITGSSRREKRRSFVGAASQRLSDLFGSSPSAKGTQASISRPMSISSQHGLASPPIDQKGDSLPSPTEFVIDKLRRTSQVENTTPEPIALTAWYASNVNPSKSMQRQMSSSRSVGALSPKEPQICSPVLHAKDTMHQLKGQQPSSNQGENRRRSSFGTSFEAGGALHKQRSSSVRPTFGLDMQPDAAAAFDCIPSPGLRSRTFSSSSAPGPAASSLSEFRASLNPSRSGPHSTTLQGAEIDQEKSASEAQMMKMSSPREELRELDPERPEDEQERLWTKTKHRRGLNRTKEQKWGSMHDTSVNDEEEPEERVKDEEEENEHAPFSSLGLHQDISDVDASRPRSRHGSADGSSVPPAFGAAGSFRSSFGSREGRRDGTSLRGSTADAEFTFAPPPSQATVPAANTRPPADTPSSPGFDELELLDDTGSATGRDLTRLVQEKKSGAKDEQQSSDTALVGGLNIFVPKVQTTPTGDRSKVTLDSVAPVRPSTAHHASPSICPSPLPRTRRPSTSASELGKNDRRSYYTFV